jgi:hypothetical protein
MGIGCIDLRKVGLLTFQTVFMPGDYGGLLDSKSSKKGNPRGRDPLTFTPLAHSYASCTQISPRIPFTANQYDRPFPREPLRLRPHSCLIALPFLSTDSLVQMMERSGPASSQLDRRQVCPGWATTLRDRLAFTSPRGIRPNFHRVDEALGSEESHQGIQPRPIPLRPNSLSPNQFEPPQSGHSGTP